MARGFLMRSCKDAHEGRYLYRNSPGFFYKAPLINWRWRDGFRTLDWSQFSESVAAERHDRPLLGHFKLERCIPIGWDKVHYSLFCLASFRCLLRLFDLILNYSEIPNSCPNEKVSQAVRQFGELPIAQMPMDTAFFLLLTFNPWLWS